MTRSIPKSLPATVALLAILLASCSDDENPAAVDSPCDDAGTACVTVRLTGDEMIHEATYQSIDDETLHLMEWDVSAVIRGYAPGQRMMVTFNFVPPLEVRYDHESQGFSFYAGANGGLNGFANPPMSFEANDWAATEVWATCTGQISTGASGLFMGASFSQLVTGTKLQSVVFDFVVPDTYTSGVGAAILPGDLDVLSIEIYTYVGGDTTNDPPVWPGDFMPR